MGKTVITGARVAAAHEGSAELVLTLGHENGGESEVTLDHIASDALMRSCHASRLEELEGHGWEKIREALKVSWNRFQSQEKNQCWIY